MTRTSSSSRTAPVLALARAAAVLLALALLSPTLSGVAPAEAARQAPVPAPVPAPVTLVIDTEGAAPIISKDDYLDATMQLDGVTRKLEIRGRGNSTWGWAKKPYKLKLKSAAGLLGMPAAQEWVLLANFADRSALRNHLAFEMARHTRLPWTPGARYVDLVVNGQSQGLYLLTDQVELGRSRVVVPKNGHLLEIDARFRRSGDPGFKSRRGTPVAFNDPDELTVRQRRIIKGAVGRFEDVLYGRGFAHPEKGYAAHIDVDSVIDWYLLEELFRNQDSNFHSSVFVTWAPGEKFAMGPVWDFDLSAGSKWNATTLPEGWHTRTGKHWVARMFQDPTFAARVRARWTALRPTFEALVAGLPASADVLREAATRDWQLWHGPEGQVSGSVHADSFDGEVAFLRTWLTERARWISDTPEVSFARTDWTVREKRRTTWVPVRLLAPSDRTHTVRYRLRGGTATPGKDFRLAEGTLVFAPGETTKSFGVQIRQDSRREAKETIALELLDPDPAMLVGGASLVRIRIAGNDGPGKRGG
ncbi:CotH kinase family protein [Nocardioides sp. 616]|uniref:CotH kinase family protein n=1 Tax=Nocardioides sp. 616 TaxID=2268090 RepID=UPI000CE4B528|nr:CotH kinase family protein [Nocardioides sp. 616]